jgi:uncharacterized protein YcbK (DUF882 family)
MKIEDLIRSDRLLIPVTHLEALNETVKRVSKIEAAYGKDLTVSSGYRSKSDHERIYKRINDRRLASGKEALRVPWGSKHLSGEAVDCLDAKQELQKFILENVHLLEEHGLWCEDFKYTSAPVAWVHFQTVAPKSGNRFFKP